MSTAIEQINWLDYEQCITSINKLSKFQQQLFAVECAYSVINIFENECPEDKRSRIVLEAIITYLLDPNEENKTALIQARTDASAYVAFYAAYYASAAVASASAAVASAAYTADVVYWTIRAIPDEEQEAKQEWINKLYYNTLKTEKEFNNNWKTTNTIQLAKQIIKTRDFSIFPILADALQDEGCNDEELLFHLRYEECYSSDWIIVNLLISG